jgi:MFS transporter, CP family, cyanate transporter
LILQSKTLNQRYLRFLALSGIVLVALNLRAAITSLSPIYAQIGQSFPLSTMAQGILGALPPLGFALFGSLTPVLNRKLGLVRSLLLAMVLVCIGQVGRSLTNDAGSFGMLYTLSLAGMGMSNVLLPPVIKAYFPGRIGLLTSIYAALTAISAGLPSLIAVPVTHATDWRFSTGIWAGVAFIAAIPWVGLIQGSQKTDLRPIAGIYRPWRRATAWALAVLFGVGALNIYAMTAWLPKILVSTAGIDPATSGTMLFFYNMIGFPAGLIVPAWLSRTRHPLGVVSFFAACLLAGYFGLATFPALSWIWIFPAGLGVTLIPIGLILINLRSRTEGGAAGLSGFVQGVGYLVGAAGPFIVGGLHSLSGEWTTAFWFLMATALLVLVAGRIAVRPGFFEDAGYRSEREVIIDSSGAAFQRIPDTASRDPLKEMCHGRKRQQKG